jgi:two-component sensor histidine kinase
MGNSDSGDRILRLSAKLLAMPLAWIGLHDQGEWRLAASLGLERLPKLFDLSAFSQNEVTVVEDALQAPNHHPWAGEMLRSLIAAPLRTSTGETLGLLCLADIRARSPEPADLADLQDLADLLAQLLESQPRASEHGKSEAALEQSQTELALHRLAEREYLLRTISDRIRQSLELAEILNTTVNAVRDLLQVDRVMIYQFQLDLSGVVIAESVASPWVSLQGQAIQDSYFFTEQCINPYTKGYVQNTPDIYTSGLSQCYVDLQAQWQVRANLVMPIFQADNKRVWGLIAAQHCAAARCWQAEEIDLLQQIASQVSLAITQAELLRQTQQQAQKERLLNWVIRAVRQSLDLQTIFITAASEIGSFLQANRVEIVQYLPERQVWQHIAEYRQSSDLPIALGVEIADANNPIADQLKQGQVVQVDRQDLSDPLHQNLALPGQWLLLPLQVAAQPWGSLNLCRQQVPWTSWEVELAQTLAAQLAIAIQQAAALNQAKAELGHRQQIEQQLRSSLREKEVLLQEVHHRVKNNLQVIYSLLSIQADMVSDSQVRAALEDSQNRVMAMAMVHQNLYQSNDFAKVNLSDYIRSLTLHLFGIFHIHPDQIFLKVNSPHDLTVPLDQAVPCGLILNELLTNAIKHGFRQPDHQGELIVSLLPSDDPNDPDITLSVVNNGAPLPQNFALATSQSMGLQLVQLLSEQLSGRLSITGGEMTNFSLSFKPGS